MDFESRVAKIADALKLPINPDALKYIAGKVLRDGDGNGSKLPDTAVATRIRDLVPTERKHFILKYAPPILAPNAPKKLGGMLERGNEIADAIRPKALPQKVTLTAEQRAWRDNYGAQALFDRWPELNFIGAPSFVPEDEGDA
jgi:hypothetical protein